MCASPLAPPPPSARPTRGWRLMLIPMATEIDLADYDYPLPPERIAQHPPDSRDGARMLVLDRASGAHCIDRARKFH